MKKLFLLGLCCLIGLCLCFPALADVGEGFPEPTYTPDMPEYYDQAGGAHYARRAFEEAIASYQRALALDPEYWHGHYGLAFTYRAMGRLDLAAEQYAKVMEMAPDYAQPYAERAEIYRFLGRDAEAESDLNRYVALGGQYPAPYVARGDFLLDAQQYRRAAEDYTTAFEQGLAGRARGAVYLKRALAWLQLGEADLAAADFEAAGQALQGADVPDPLSKRTGYEEAQAAPGAVPYAFDGFETYVVIIGACDLNPAGWTEEAAEERLETIRSLQDAFFALSDFYYGYAPQTVENGNALISIVNQVLPMLDTYQVTRFDSSECNAYELWEIIADAWYAFDPEGAASADMEPTVEMVEFVLYQ